jgi:hypothetical protein
MTNKKEKIRNLRHRCVYCGKKATKQCDAFDNDEVFCAKTMCEKCAVAMEGNIDYCKEHYELIKKGKLVC